MTTTRLTRTACLVSSLAVIGALAVSGRTVCAAAAETAADSGGLEEVTVTAQRRKQSLQDVPLSVMAIGAEQIQRTAITSLEGLNKLVPDVIIEHVSLFNGAAALSMRGVGYAGIESYTDPDVAVFINGVYQPRNAIALTSTLDVSDVEILRGPQGTLYGRNAYAGAVSVTTNLPNLTDAKGTASFSVGNYGTHNEEFVGNLPLADGKAAFRLAVRQHNFDGFYRNNGLVYPAATANTPGVTSVVDATLYNKPAQGEDNLYVRPSFRFAPNDAWDSTFMAEFYRDRSQANAAIHFAAFNTSGQRIADSLSGLGFPGYNPFGDSSYGIAGDGSDPFKTGFSLGNRPQSVDSWNITNQTSFRTAYGTFKGIFSYGKAKSEIWSDTDGENQNFFTSGRWEDYRSSTAELQFLSSAWKTLDLIAGLSYLQDHYQTTQTSFTSFAAALIPQFTLNSVNPAYINNEGFRKAYAAYLQAEWHITDPLSLVVGGRYSHEKKYDYRGENTSLEPLSGAAALTTASANFPATFDPSSHQFSTAVFPASYPLVSLRGQPIVFAAPDASWSNFAPRVGLNYKVNPDFLAFVFWQRAFKAGGFNANSGDRQAFQSPYGDEQVDNYELGFKSEWLDHRLRANFNVFYGKYTGLQRTLVTPSQTAPSGVSTVTTNLADLDSKGFEIELAGKANKYITVFANIGYDKAEYKSYCAPLQGATATITPAISALYPQCGAVQQISATSFLVPLDYSKLQPIRAPKWDVTAGFTADFQVGAAGSGEWTVSANERSSMYVNLLNVPLSYRPDLFTADTSFTFIPASEKYKVQLWIRNITNKVEILNLLQVGGNINAGGLFTDGAPTDPRTFGATFSVNF